jgi:hypothetical protein
MQDHIGTMHAAGLAARPLTPAAPVPALRGEDLLAALLAGTGLDAAVPTALAIVERDPLATCGRFRGDTMRALMEVPGLFWTRHPHWYARYLLALRASAGARRRLPDAERMEFWNTLE